MKDKAGYKRFTKIVSFPGSYLARLGKGIIKKVSVIFKFPDSQLWGIFFSV